MEEEEEESRFPRSLTATRSASSNIESRCDPTAWTGSGTGKGAGAANTADAAAHDATARATLLFMLAESRSV